MPQYDKEHKIQHISVEYGITVMVVPSQNSHSGMVAQGGYGSLCGWNAKKRKEAYEMVIEFANRALRELE